MKKTIQPKLSSKIRNSKHPADIYAKGILSGKILSSKLIKLACKRYVDERGIYPDKQSDGIWFSDAKGQRVISFFTTFLQHSKGEWAGTRFVLEPWQEFILYNMFGWMKGGVRRFRTLYLEVARKNGKTTMLAGIGLYLLLCDGEPGAEIYAAATKFDQAKISHSEASRMVNASPALRQRIKVFTNNLSITGTASKFEPLGADRDTFDGLNVHGALIDELHAHKTRGLWDVMETATGSRRQPMLVSITTAGFDRHSICWEQHEYLEKILTGVLSDDTYFGLIYSIDKDDDWRDEPLWVKANPNLNVSVKIDDLQRKCQKAKEMATAQNAFRRLHMDEWTESYTRWFSHDDWKACDFQVDEEALTGRECFGGLDLSSTTDITALVLVFTPLKEGDRYEVLCRFFVPEDNVAERARRDRVPYDLWIKNGLIKATPGNVVDYGYVLNQIDKDMKKFNMKELAFDKWGASKIIQDIQELSGHDDFLVETRQGFFTLSPPTKELEVRIMAKNIAHGGNPVLSWMASNVVLRSDAAENIKPDKEKSTERIDGIVALIMALDRALKHKTFVSVYETQGIKTF